MSRNWWNFNPISNVSTVNNLKAQAARLLKSTNPADKAQANILTAQANRLLMSTLINNQRQAQRQYQSFSFNPFSGFGFSLGSRDNSWPW